jgi:hypothetical protein
MYVNKLKEGWHLWANQENFFAKTAYIGVKSCEKSALPKRINASLTLIQRKYRFSDF